jgi:hypothetical protein
MLSGKSRPPFHHTSRQCLKGWLSLRMSASRCVLLKTWDILSPFNNFEVGTLEV